MKIPSSLLKTIVFVVRTILGATFVFSGFVKAIDPKGLGYKIADYMSAMNLSFAEWLNIPIIAGITIICIEFLLGIYLLLGLRRRFAAIVSLLVMLVFTIISVVLVIWHPVEDCGCFGDFIVLTDTQSLVKNIALLAFALMLNFSPTKAPKLVPIGWQWLIGLYSSLFIIIFTVISSYFLPMIDFRPYKVGANLREMVFPQEANTDDSEDAFVDFFVTDTLGQDVTDKILNEKGRVFLAISPSLKDADFSVTEDFNALNDWCQDKGGQFYCLTASSVDEINDWCYYNDAQYQFLQADGTVLKTMIRSNPGLMLIRDGVISNKWSVHNMPEITSENFNESQFENNSRSTVKIMAIIVFWYIVPLIALILLSNITHGIGYIFRTRKKKTLKQSCQDNQINDSAVETENILESK